MYQTGKYNLINLIRSDTESAGRYSRSEIDGASSRGQRKSRISLSRLFGRKKDKVSGADTDTMRTVVTIDDDKVNYCFLMNKTNVELFISFPFSIFAKSRTDNSAPTCLI